MRDRKRKREIGIKVGGKGEMTSMNLLRIVGRRQHIAFCTTL